jgi:hypothetical protein
MVNKKYGVKINSKRFFVLVRGLQYCRHLTSIRDFSGLYIKIIVISYEIDLRDLISCLLR